MKRYIFTFLFFTLFIFQSAFACSCFGPSSFCEFVSRDIDWASNLIVKGTKLRNVDHGMDFEITEIYKGIESKRVIRIWGDLGWLCRWYASSFADGEEYYFALHEIYVDTENPWSPSPLEKNGDYYISFCGKTYWHKSDEDLRDELESDLINCLNELTPPFSSGVNATIDEDFCNIEKTHLSPNPTNHKTFIQLTEDHDLTKGTARIYDTCGKLVFQLDNINQFYSFGRFTFNVSSLASGLYFLDLNLPELCDANLTRRLVVR